MYRQLELNSCDLRIPILIIDPSLSGAYALLVLHLH